MDRPFASEGQLLSTDVFVVAVEIIPSYIFWGQSYEKFLRLIAFCIEIFVNLIRVVVVTSSKLIKIYFKINPVTQNIDKAQKEGDTAILPAASRMVFSSHALAFSNIIELIRVQRYK